MTKMVIDIIGWVAMLMILYAYYLICQGKVTAKTLSYQLLNLVGASLFVINLAYFKAWPSVALNFIWALIAVSALYSKKKEKPDSGKVEDDN